MPRRRTSWHIWSSRLGYHKPPEPMTNEIWKRINGLERLKSGDGNWMEIYDDEGLPMLVLVRHRFR